MCDIGAGVLYECEVGFWDVSVFVVRVKLDVEDVAAVEFGNAFCVDVPVECEHCGVNRGSLVDERVQATKRAFGGNWEDVGVDIQAYLWRQSLERGRHLIWHFGC